MARLAKAGLVATLLVTACGSDSSTSPPQQALAFVVQPSRVMTKMAVTPPPQVAIRNLAGEVTPNATSAVTVVLSVPSASVLSGKTVVDAVSGVATFSDLLVDRPGYYRLKASVSGAIVAFSDTFRVFPPYHRIGAGDGHSCGVTVPGSAYCWGRNSSGQLGVPITGANTSIPQEVPMPGGARFTTIVAGGYHTCALAESGAPYCWGYNVFNQLGDGTTETRSTPTLVDASGVSFAGISAGYWHSCGVAISGSAYCWGLNVEGALGDGTTTTPGKPVVVAAPVGVTFSSVSAGGGHTCGVTPTSAAYCWGENPYGGLGDGSNTARTSPVLVAAPAGVSFSSVSAGDEHSCGLTPSGAAYCWGRNDVAQLGDGTTTSRSTPVLVAAPSGVTFATIDAGRLRTCAVAAAPIPGAIYCWGANLAPSLVPAPPGVIFSAVDLGSEHSCAVTPIGIAYCWGNGGYGQLGNSGGGAAAPVRVDQ